MKITYLLVACAAFVLQSCFSLPSVAVHAGFASLALNGDVGFVPASSDSGRQSSRSGDGGSAGSIRQDIDDALGLGDYQGYTHVRKDNLVKPMVVGSKKVADPTLESARGGGLIAFAVAVVITAAALWVSGGALVPPPPPPPPALGW